MFVFIHIDRSKVCKTQMAIIQNKRSSLFFFCVSASSTSTLNHDDLTLMQLQSTLVAVTITGLSTCKEPARCQIISYLCVSYIEACNSMGFLIFDKSH